MRTHIAMVFSVVLILVGAANASDYSGVYTLNSGGEAITLQLDQEGSEVFGSFTRAGRTYAVEGEVQQGAVIGVLFNEDNYEDYMYFSAQASGRGLALALYRADENDEPNMNNPLGQFSLSKSAARSDDLQGIPPADPPQPSGMGLEPMGSTPGGPTSSTSTGGAGGNGRPIQAGQTYNAGARLQSTLAGISLTVPESFSGGYDRDAASVVLKSQGILMGLYGYSEAKPEDIIGVVAEALEKEGAQLIPQGVTQVDERTIEAVSQILTQQGSGIIYGLIRQGDYGNALGVFAMGSDRASLEKSVRAVMGSVAWSQPEAQGWRQRVAGRRFSTTGSGSMFSQGGAGGSGSFASESNTAIDLCSDGSYFFESEGTSLMSIEGMSAESNTSDSHSGRWWLVSDLAGAATLALYSTEGSFYTYTFVEQGQGVALNGQMYSVGYGQRCQ